MTTLVDEKLNFSKEEFENLPLNLQIAVTASSKLVKHLKILESQKALTKPEATNLIGCVKKLRDLIFEKEA